MCKVGDIIIIEKFKNETGEDVARHPFIVISTKNGIIESMSFDMIGVLMSSIKNEEHRKKKLSYDVNIELKKEAGAKVDSYIKGNQLYCFQQDKIDYFKVGCVDIDVFLELREEIKKLAKQRKAVFITTNLEDLEELEEVIEL